MRLLNWFLLVAWFWHLAWGWNGVSLIPISNKPKDDAMSNFSVRQAVLSDLDALAPLFDGYRQFYQRESNLDAVRAFLLKRFEQGDSVLFIALDDSGAALGFTQLYPSFSSTSLARIFVLNDLFVASSVRKAGLGSLLLKASAQFAKAVGAIRLELSTALTNHTAQSVYQRNGWRKDEQFWVYQLKLV